MGTKRRLQSYDVFFPGGVMDDVYPEPIISNRAPTVDDDSEIGTIWVDQTLDDAYILTTTTAGSSTWINMGGGGGTFSSITVNPGDITATAGDVVVTAGSISVPLGDVGVTAGALTLGALGVGVMQTSAAGLVTSDGGTDGQIMISATAAAPAWAGITAGAGITVNNAANSIQIVATGATASSFDGDGGNATPDGTGTTTMAGGTNITTAAAANTVTFNLDGSPSVAGSLTAGVDLNMTTGDCTISANTDGAQTIYLHADGGVTETIDIHADQGTGAASVYVHSDDGGVTITGGLATADAINLSAAAGGVDIDGALQVNIASSQDAASAIVLSASAGGIDITSAGAAGEDIDITTSSSINLVSSENAANAVYLHANGGANETIYLHADQGTGADSINLVSDVGGVTVSSGLAGNDAIVLNSTAGGIDVDAVLQINVVSAQAAATAIVVDASNAAGGIDVDYGTGGMTVDGANGAFTLQTGTGNIGLGADAAAKVITIGNVTGATQVVINSGTGNIELASTGAGDITIDSSDTLLLDSDGVLELNSSAGIIGIGNDADAQNMNIGTGAAERIITIGNITTATQVVVDCGTAGVSVGASATAHPSTFGSTNGGSATDLQAGTGALTLTAGGIFDINATGAITIDSSGGTIGIGDDDIDQAINIGVVGERVITVGNIVGVTGIALNSGTAGITMASTGTGDITLDSSDTCLIDAAGVLELNSSAGVIGIGNDAISQNINIATGAAARILTLGNVTGATQVVVDCGTAGVSIGASATEHTSTFGSTNAASAATIQTGTGAFTCTAGGIFDVNVTGAITIDSSGGTIGIGDDDIDQAINIGVVGERVITIGNIVGAAEIALNAGTGGIALASTGTGDITINSDDTLLLDADGVLELNSSGGAISIGNDADAQGINIGTGAADKNIAIGNTTAGTEVVIEGGNNGDILLTPATVSGAGAALTLNAKVGSSTHTGVTTASTAQETFTITNSEVSATSAIIVTVTNVGAADARMAMEQVKPAAGSFEVMTQNNGAAQLADNVVINWIVLS